MYVIQAGVIFKETFKRKYVIIESNVKASFKTYEDVNLQVGLRQLVSVLVSSNR